MTVSKEERDTLLGRTISAAIAGTGTGDPCPGAETIAALVDGKLSDSERDLLMKHLACCKECFQLYTLSAELVKPVERKHSQNLVVLMGSIAAVLVAVIGLILVSRPTEQRVAGYVPPIKALPGATVTTKEPARTEPLQLAKTEEDPLAVVATNMARQLPKNVSYAPVAVDRSLGFASKPDKNRDSVSMGRNLLLLEICLVRNDRGKAVNTLTEIRRFAERLNLPMEAQKSLKRLAEGLAKRNNLDWARGQGGRAVAAVMEREGRSYMLLGEWVQGAIMASGAELPAYFTSSYFVRTSAELASAAFPADIAAMIKEVAVLGRQSPLGEKEYLRIEMVAGELAGE